MGCSLAMKAKGSLALVSLVAMISILGAGAGAGTVQPSRIVRQVPAMYVFGDSGLDVGNNNFLPVHSVPRANKPWYGVDFPGSWPTGRFSNGYNVADFVAMALGLKQSPPAYLSLAPRPISLVLSAVGTGVNYASGGAGILDCTNGGFAGNNIPLSQQVRHFQSTKAAMVAKVGSRAVSDLLARSFFLIGVGSNDLFFFAASIDAAALHTILISHYSAAITGLYEMGARKFGIINVGPIGCVPFARVFNATGACNDGLNHLAAGFDDALRSLLAGLASSLPGVTYSLADNFGLSQDTFANPQASGFVNIDSACCGSGRLGAQGDCLPNSTLCPNRDHFLFWDRFHPSQRFGKLSAAAYYDGPAQFTLPINFKQLAMHKTS